MLKSRKKRGHYKHHPCEVRMAVISEVETGIAPLCYVARKYDVNESTVRNWIRKRSGIEKNLLPLQSECASEIEPSLPGAKEMSRKEDLLMKMSEAELRAEVLRLQKELKIASLRAEALDVMIDIAERQEGIRIRKKSGAKRS